jgi:6-phosphogluconolactonase
MDFRRAAGAARAGKYRVRQIFLTLVAVVALAGLSVSCGNSSKSSASHNAYVTLPQKGNVALLHINDSTGAISLIAQTASVIGTQPTGLALDPSKKFLYVSNGSPANTVSIYSIAGDGTLTQTGAAIPVGSGPRSLVMDPSGKYLLITNAFDKNVSVYSVASGALTLVGNSDTVDTPNQLTFFPSGEFVYVSTSTGFIRAYAFDSGTGNLTEIPGSPFPSGGGVAGLEVDKSRHFLCAANATDGTVSVFAIDSGSGAIRQISGSPFAAGTGPRALTVDTTNAFLYVANQGSSNISAFALNAAKGTLTPISGSPFSAGTQPIFILAEPGGGFIYAGNQSSSNVSSYSYDTTTGKLTAVSGSPFTVDSAPGAMVVVH